MSEPQLPGKFYGKYRGTVVQNVDPEIARRIMCMVPDVLGLGALELVRGMHAAGGADGAADGAYMVPPIGAGVWVEFEHGDPTSRSGPAAGSRRRQSAAARVRRAARVSEHLLQTLLQNAIMISDLPGPDGRHHAEEHDRRDAASSTTPGSTSRTGRARRSR